MLSYKFNRRGQVSDALTWVVTTIIIIFLIVASIYISSLMGKAKSVERQKISITGENINWIGEKTEIAYNINNKDKDKIEIWISGSDIENE